MISLVFCRIWCEISFTSRENEKLLVLAGNEGAFDTFYDATTKKAQQHTAISQPQLPRKRKALHVLK